VALGAAMLAASHNCGAGCSHPKFADLGIRKPRPARRRPARPNPGATTAQLERRYPELVTIMCERTARYGGGHDANVYAWESQIWADVGLDDSPLLSPTQAQDLAAGFWAKYAPRFEPYFSGVPEVRVLGEAEAVGGARAQALHHRILIDQRCCRAAWLIHEALHLMLPAEQHGGTWASAMVTAWSQEFGINVAHALALAAQHGVTVGRHLARNCHL
jgi:hypothetical protein